MNKDELKPMLSRLYQFIVTADKFPVELKVSKYVEHRTLSQSNLMWMWMTELADYFTARGFPLNKDDAHDLMRHKFLGYSEKKIGNTEIRPQLRSTTSLDKGEMTEYLERIDAWAVEHGCRLTYPQDSEYARLKNE